MPDETLNELFRDALIRHQIGLMRVSAGVRNKIWALLNATEEDLSLQLEKRLETIAGKTLKPTTLKRLNVLAGVVKEIRGKAFDKMHELWNETMRELVEQEADFIRTTLQTLAPVKIDMVLPSRATLRSLVAKQPFEGKTLRQWANSLRDTDVSRIMDQVKIGMVQGESAADIARRVIGTKTLSYTNGVTEMTRRDAASITRTAINHYANQSKKQTFEDNADIVDKELFVATLDARTTPVCRSLDGKTFPVGEGPRPPLHFGCRSLRIAIIDDQIVGDRPMKPVTENMLAKEYAQKKGYDGVKTRDDLPHGTKGKFDTWARKRTRELIGTVPATTTYQQFLSKQPVAFQEEVLGKTKARLFRKGGLQLDRFVDRQGNELTLAELAKKERQAFLDAGLDPDSY